MIAMQDKSGFIQEASVIHPDRTTTTTTINRTEDVHLLPTSQIIAPNNELLPSQMTKSHSTMVNEAACSTTTVDTINSNTNTMANSASTPPNDVNQVSSRPQSQHSNNSHTSGTANSPAPPPTTNCARSAKRTANDYRFGKTIGEGSFSSVYIAQDIHTKKEVASKFYTHCSLFSFGFSSFLLFTLSFCLVFRFCLFFLLVCVDSSIIKFRTMTEKY